MARKRFSAEQIIHKLREAEVELAKGQPLKAVCKKIEITEPEKFQILLPVPTLKYLLMRLKRAELSKP